jgi:ABC-type multidrug transport system fused ATPase/permease subunit
VQKETIGHYITLAGDEANRASQIVASFTRLVPIGALVCLYGAALFVHSAQLGTAILLFFLVTLLSLWGGFRKSLELGRRQQQESRTLNTHFIESLSGLRTVRGYNGEDFVSDKYDRMISGYAWTSFAVDLVNLLGRMIPAALLVLLLLAGILLFLDERTFSQHVAFAFVSAAMVMRLLPVVGQGLDAMLRLTADLKAASNVSEVLEVVRSAGSKPSGARLAMLKSIVRIDFEKVRFSYGDAAPDVLRDFSATFEAGHSYAIAGPSGSGKSTLVDLLLGFFAPRSGRIRVNGIDVSEIPMESLRHRIALVEQSTRVFHASILQNVVLGRNLPQADAERSLADAEMEDFVARLNDGADTVLAFQGSNLSGGQRQRLGIARGLAGAPDVIILDESTAGLDADTRDRVVRKLRQLFRERILILLTHDEDLLSQVDVVVSIAPASAGPAGRGPEAGPGSELALRGLS